MKIKLVLSMLVVALVSTMTVHADSHSEPDVELPEGFEVSSEATFTSNYIFRGQSSSADRPAVQQDIVVDHESGLFAGLFGSSFNSSTADLEAQYSVGYKSSLDDLFEYEVAIVYYDVLGSGTEEAIFNGDAEAEVTIGYELNELGSVDAHVAYGLGDDGALYYAVNYNSTFDATVKLGSLEDVGLHVDVNYDVLNISGYNLGAQLSVLMPEDDYKTANSLEDSELSYNISLSKAF